MIVTCVYIHVKSERIDDFIKASIENHQASVMEPGNLRFDLLQDESNPSRFMLYEAYESEEAAQAHKTTIHYLKWRDNVSDWMEEPRSGIRYSVVAPQNPEAW